MCLGIPGRVLRLEADHPDLVVVDVSGAEQPINAGILDEPLEVGDWIVIHMGFALEKISEEGAMDALSVLNTLGPSAGGSLPLVDDEPPPW